MIAWLTAAILSLFAPADIPAPRIVVLQYGHMQGLAAAVERTSLVVFEETYCLIGIARPNGVYHILGIVKPPQRAEIHRAGLVVMSVVYSKPCPPGTVGDIHSHPFGSPNPSPIDVDNWRRQRRFTLHMIGAMLGPQRAGFVAYDTTDPEHPVKLKGMWLVVLPKEER